MISGPLRLVASLSGSGNWHFEVWQEAAPPTPEVSSRVRVGALEPDQSITLANGERYTIVRTRSVWWPDRALWSGDGPTSGSAPLAVYELKRLRRWRWHMDPILRVGGEAGPVYLMRRRSLLRSDLGVDVVPLPASDQDLKAAGAVLMRVADVGYWEATHTMQAEVFDPIAWKLPIVLFVLNLIVNDAIHRGSGD